MSHPPSLEEIISLISSRFSEAPQARLALTCRKEGGREGKRAHVGAGGRACPLRERDPIAPVVGMIHEERDRMLPLLVSLPEMLPQFRDTETSAVRRDIIPSATGRTVGAR